MPRPILPPASPDRHRAFSEQRTKDTQPEVALRRELRARGLVGYRKHMRLLPDRRRTADIVFTRAKVAIFVDGCFWHGCPDHGTWPKTNATFWRTKIEGNARRDAETDSALAAAGWAVVRIWEHEESAVAAERVQRAVQDRLSNS